jgi:N-acyl-D-amino-acid deacylase
MPDLVDSCDLLITGGTVIDGTGAARRVADVAITGNRIVGVGDLGNCQAAERVNATGLMVTPGFIDAHTHDDRAVLVDRPMAAKVSQGVTSVIAGNCGISLAPLAHKEPPPPLNLLGDASCFFSSMHAYMDAVDAHPSAVNVAILVGHSTLRVAVMDSVDRPARADEIEQMGVLLDEAMEAGAIGLSTGLAYPTAKSAPTDEVVALTERAARHGGLYATHMRDEENFVTESVDETVTIGERAEARVVISHHKACGRANWGRTRETLRQIDAANDNGVQVDFDVYPYVASSTVLLEVFVHRAERVLVTWSHAHPEVKGQDLEDIRAGWDCSLSEAIERLQPAGAIYFQMDEDDLQRVLRHPGSMVGSDGLPHDEHPHPRLWGTFPRVLGHYSRDIGLFDLETAVHKMTGLTARVFGLTDRGVIRAGAFADITIFDADTVIDAGDFNNPTVPARGIEKVFVNGACVWRDRATTDERPGRMLRRDKH